MSNVKLGFAFYTCQHPSAKCEMPPLGIVVCLGRGKTHHGVSPRESLKAKPCVSGGAALGTRLLFKLLASQVNWKLSPEFSSSRAPHMGWDGHGDP